MNNMGYNSKAYAEETEEHLKKLEEEATSHTPTTKDNNLEAAEYKINQTANDNNAEVEMGLWNNFLWNTKFHCKVDGSCPKQLSMGY